MRDVSEQQGCVCVAGCVGSLSGRLPVVFRAHTRADELTAQAVGAREQGALAAVAAHAGARAVRHAAGVGAAQGARGPPLQQGPCCCWARGGTRRHGPDCVRGCRCTTAAAVSTLLHPAAVPIHALEGAHASLTTCRNASGIGQRCDAAREQRKS